MKYYPACVDDTGVNASIADDPKRVLLSYHYYKKKTDYVKQLLKSGIDVFLDSGAFSAENLGKPINIDDYCKYIISTGVKNYAVLDVIGDSVKTMINQRYMEKEYELNPIPVFHMGGRVEELKKLLDYNYIALGGLVTSPNIKNHCDACWEVILNHNTPTKIHGFGLTNIKILSRYPWYSVDSSSFQGCRRFGRQQMMNNDYNFYTIKEDEFLNYLVNNYMYDKNDLINNHKKRRYLEDYFSVTSMKRYISYLTKINKNKKFSHLTDQLMLF